jgi:superfamily II DNA or RNA helicase/intein/homing endonuclease
MHQFDIQIEDGSNTLSEFTVEQNTSSLQLYDWQRRAIKYFFDHNGIAIFEVATGCLTGDTLIETPRNLDEHPKGIKIKDLVGQKDLYVYSFNIKKQKIELKKVNRVWMSEKNRDVYEITLLSGKKIKATSNHPFLVDIREKPEPGCGKGTREKIIDRQYKKLENLKVGDYLTVFNRSKMRSKDGELLKVFYEKDNRRILEHRFILEQLYGKLHKHDIGHHKDNNRFNNEIKNLEKMNSMEHNRYHTLKRGFFGAALWKKNGHPKGFKGKKHSDETKKLISINTTLALRGEKYIKNKRKNIMSEYKENGFNSYIYKSNKKISCLRCSQTLKTRSAKFMSKRGQYGGRTNYSDKIIKIKYKGKEDVYDMSVEENHNFIANNFIVHNSGKTTCAIEIVKNIWKTEPELQVLIVVPKNVILETGWYKELYDAGVSLKDIGVFYGGAKEYGKVTITNMQSVDKMALELFDIIIYDEIHNYGTKRMLKFIEYPFKYKIGLSATLERRDASHWKILEAFNYNWFKYSPKEALADDVLNPFNFVNIGVKMDDETYEKYLKLTAEINLMLQIGGSYGVIMRGNTGLKFRLLAKMNSRKALVNNYKRKFDVLKEICFKHRKDKMIVFNEFNAQTNKTYWFLLDVGMKACVIHSGINKEKRDQALMDYKNDKYNVILTSKVLDEGYNLPKLDVAIIAAGNSTGRQTIQRMGRVLRKKDKHSILYQVYCSGTIEENYAYERSKLFKELCSNYNEYFYDGEELGI